MLDDIVYMADVRDDCTDNGKLFTLSLTVVFIIDLLGGDNNGNGGNNGNNGGNGGALLDEESCLRVTCDFNLLSM